MALQSLRKDPAPCQKCAGTGYIGEGISADYCPACDASGVLLDFRYLTGRHALYDGAKTLAAFLALYVADDPALGVVDVQDAAGRTFERVSLIERTLSDGSKVYNLVLEE